MRFVQYQDNVSLHQLPLARAMVEAVGEASFRYVYRNELNEGRRKMGWSDGDLPTWCINEASARDWLEYADVMLTGIRCVDLMRRRLVTGRRTYFMSERWFRPEIGWLRLLHPKFFITAVAIARLFEYPDFRYFPIGLFARTDMLRLLRLFGLSNVEGKFVPWGYFVEPTSFVESGKKLCVNGNLKVLWVGRMIHCKRVDTIVRAVSLYDKFSARPNRKTLSLTIVGDGPERRKVQKLAAKLGLAGPQICFLPFVKSDEVRKIMREHDVFVFASDAREGWGAVVSEALEEDMIVLGTRQSGAPPVLLPEDHLFDAGDYKILARKLADVADGKIQKSGIGDWTANKAAERLLRL